MAYLVRIPFTVHLTAMKARTVIAGLSLACAVAVPLHAQEKQAATAPQPTASVAPSEPGSNLTVYLLTFGWGDVVWERFGHNAIWIKDRARGTDMTYNWGMFDFNQPHFVWRFVTGDTRYWMEPIDYNSMVTYYKQHNRSILAQELNLTPAQRLMLQQFVQWNALPRNKFYRYDYYRDNCSTRLRDAIDHALSGQLQTSTVTRMTSGTYRWHTQRLMTGDIPLYTGVTLALGHPADKPLSMWEEMFLPVRMANDLVAVGIIFAAVLVLLVRSAEGGNRLAMFTATALATLWSLIAGLGGLALVFAWFFTTHYFMGRNENLMHFDPLSIVLVVLIPLSIYARRGISRAIKFAGFIALLCLFGFVAQGIPLFDQKNGEIIALALPINLAVWWTVFRLTAYSRTSLPSSAAL